MHTSENFAPKYSGIVMHRIVADKSKKCTKLLGLVVQNQAEQKVQ